MIKTIYYIPGHNGRHSKQEVEALDRGEVPPNAIPYQIIYDDDLAELFQKYRVYMQGKYPFIAGVSLSRYLAEMFYGPGVDENGKMLFVHHRNAITTDVRRENLCWVTPKENSAEREKLKKERKNKASSPA